jgi:hypothetical protein
MKRYCELSETSVTSDNLYANCIRNNVDFCSEIGGAGYRVIWTPSSVAEHR